MCSHLFVVRLTSANSKFPLKKNCECQELNLGPLGGKKCDIHSAKRPLYLILLHWRLLSTRPVVETNVSRYVETHKFVTMNRTREAQKGLFMDKPHDQTKPFLHQSCFA